MRSEILRTYRKVHTWTGIIAGLFLFIAFYGGAITVFRDPLTRWVDAPNTAASTDFDRAGDLIAKTLAAHPEAAREFSLLVSEKRDGSVEPARDVQLSWQKSRRDGAPFSASLDAEGALKVAQIHPSGLFPFIDIIHRTGGLPFNRDIGEWIMGVVSGLYFLAVFAGVIIILPALAREIFALRIGPNVKRMWMDVHNLIGLLSLPFHIVIALTAFVFCLHDLMLPALDKVVFEGRLPALIKAGNPGSRPPAANSPPATMLPPQVLLEKVAALAPDFQPTRMQYRAFGTQTATLTITGFDPRHMMRLHGSVVVSPVTGDIVNAEYLPGHGGTWATITSAFFALHFASYGGTPIHFSYLLLGLAGAVLFYSGNLLWIESRRRSERKNGSDVTQTRATRIMAAITVGVSLGCIAGISSAIVIGKWVSGRVIDPDLWHMTAYYAVFAGCVLFALKRGAARASVELLHFAAVVTAAIPVTCFLAMIFPALKMEADPQINQAVFIVGLVAALVLFRLAGLTQRRVEEGPADSIWSLASSPEFQVQRRERRFPALSLPSIKLRQR
ncbi:PepSY-associated TM helix domain-containing protein [Beijerinckia mobilis]|uniref:PepSY-associated TM helix domain-containing protein n=1 Tax=Beijerinckia mobilis TaxID=231434 RepID=UPI000A04A6DF|nr:PepSY-associated TM helix domain-containing protein [Beijerinckia mobilis]